MSDKIGDRFKENYENRTRYLLPRRTYTIIRLDGKAFHTFTKRCHRPFDEELMWLMNETAIKLCEQIQGVRLAYVQSDEISLLLTDFDGQDTSAWFDGNILKMSSISASIATASFNANLTKMATTLPDSEFDTLNKFIAKDGSGFYQALFDSRVFSVPEDFETENYFIWRQMDCTKNSIQMVAQSLYSHKELHGKNTSVLQEMIFQKGINWNDYPVRCKRGAVIAKEYFDKDGAKRSHWVVQEPPIFTQDRTYLRGLIPVRKSWEN